MPVKNLYTDVTVGGNPVDIISIEVTEGYRQTTATCNIETEDITGVSLNGAIIADIGYDSSHGVIFRGLVDEISETRPPGIYTISGRDILKRAMEYFLVTTDIEHPWSRENIAAENLVRDLLAEAGIVGYAGDTSNFTFGVQGPAEFNMMTSWDAVNMINNILAYYTYAEDNIVYFQRMFPVPGASTNILRVGNVGNIELIDYGYNTDNLRNKIVVFGKSPITAEASRADSWDPRVGAYVQLLPVDFYKTVIVSNELIDTQAMADGAVNYNLDLYNRLTEFMRVECEGLYTVRCRDTVTVIEPFTGMSSDDWFVFSASHRIDDNGYRMSLNLSR